MAWGSGKLGNMSHPFISKHLFGILIPLLGINVPFGFAVTTKAYDKFIQSNGLDTFINDPSIALHVRQRYVYDGHVDDLHDRREHDRGRDQAARQTR